MNLPQSNAHGFLYHDEMIKDNINKHIPDTSANKTKTTMDLLIVIISDFLKVNNSQSFKDCYKRLRKIVKENPDLSQNEIYQPIFTILTRALCIETCLGRTLDIKGIINELLESFSANEYYANKIANVFETRLKEFINSTVQTYSLEENNLDKLYTNISLERIDEDMKILNQFAGLYPFLAGHSKHSLDPLLKIYNSLLKLLTLEFENNRHHSAQFLSELNFLFRGYINVLVNFKEIVMERIKQNDNNLLNELRTISSSGHTYLASLRSLNSKTSTQCAILVVLIDLQILARSEEDYEKILFVESKAISPFSGKTCTMTKDDLQLKRLLVIQSLANFRETFDVFKRLQSLESSPFGFILKLCQDSNAHLRFNAFKTLNIVLQTMNSNKLLQEKLLTELSHKQEIFELSLKNWESSLKGLTQEVEEIFDTTLKILTKQDELSNKSQILTALQKQVMSIGDTNLKTKYGALILIIKHIDVSALLENHTNLIQELFLANRHTYIASSVILFEKLLARLHEKIIIKNAPNKNDLFIQWTGYWIKIFSECLDNEDFNAIKGLMNHSVPVICRIDKSCCGYLINILKGRDLSKKNILWCYVSLIKIARMNDLLECAPQNKGYQFKDFVVGSNQKLLIETSFLEAMILNANQSIMLSILEAITVSPKPADVPETFEYELVLVYLEHSIRTSYSDIRNNSITILKKFITRLRLIYDPLCVQYFPLNKTEFSKDYLDSLEAIDKKQLTKSLKVMIGFLKKAFSILSLNLKPEAEYETIYPTLEILRSFVQLFGLNDYSYRKNTVFKGTSLLCYIDVYNQNVFNSLVNSLRSPWEYVRSSAQDILMEFPNNYSGVTTEYLSRDLLSCALSLVVDPIPRNFEAGARLLLVIARKFIDKVDFSILKVTSEVSGKINNLSSILKFSYYILEILKSKFENLKQHFLEDETEFSKNLIHGLVTALGFLIRECASDESMKSKDQAKHFRSFFKDLSETIQQILLYTTKLSADQLALCVLNNDARTKELNKQVQIKKLTVTDCRGHFISEKPEEALKYDNLKLQKILNDSPEDTEEDVGDNADIDTENIAVIAFYLIAKESSMLLESISAFILSLDEKTIDTIASEDIRSLFHTYLHTLLNIKHLGSMDKIAHGVLSICTHMYQSKHPALLKLAEELLEKILIALENDEFKSTLRRSAGLPSAIICLLKSEPYGQKAQLFPKTVQKLLNLSENGHTNEIRVHALNILKFIFQDSTLKVDIEAYVSSALMIAIRGFSVNNWGIRNSALMLFSSIAKRTLGQDQQGVKSNVSITEFFTKAPELVNFFLTEVDEYVRSGSQKEQLYPSLYPIALIMSRLLPRNFENLQQKITEDIEPDEEKRENEKSAEKLATIAELQKFLPLFIQAAQNKNYMGRLMCARAVLPFIQYENVIDQLINLFDLINLASINQATVDHNFAHGLLLQIYYILKNFLKLQKTYPHMANNFNDHQHKLIDKLRERMFLLTDINCPFVSTVYLQILKRLLKYNTAEKKDYVAHEVFVEAFQYCFKELENNCKDGVFRLFQDFGTSVMRLKYLKFVLVYDFSINKNLEVHRSLLTSFVETYKKNLNARKNDDNELLKALLEQWNKHLKCASKPFLSLQNKTEVIDVLLHLLNQNEFLTEGFLGCIEEILKLIIVIDYNEVMELGKTNQMLRCLDIIHSRFSDDTKLMKPLIKLYGVLLSGCASLDSLIFIKNYSIICNKFSAATQVDFLRIAVLKSIKISLKRIMPNLHDISLFLSFSRTIIRLLQDDIPEIRSKMGNCISKIYELSQAGSQQYKLNPDIVLQKYFEHILSSCWKHFENNDHNQSEIIQFIFSYIFESEFEYYKQLGHFEKKVYAIERPNKFHSDFLLATLLFEVLMKGISNQTLSLECASRLLTDKKHKFHEIALKNADGYIREVLNRDEFLFECVLRKMHYDLLVRDILSVQSDFNSQMEKNKFSVEPCFRYIIEKYQERF